MEAVDKGFVFVGGAKAAAEVEDGVVVVQGERFQKGFQFLEAVPDPRWVLLVGFCVGSVKLIQHRRAIRIVGIECMVLGAVLQQF